MDQKIERRPHRQQSPNNSKPKKKGPLKVVHIANPIKFTATASEFRALVQELTGQDSGPPDSAGPAAVRGGSGRRGAEEGPTKEFGVCEGVQNGSGQVGFESGYEYGHDGLFDPVKMDDSFQGLMASGFWNEGADDIS
ncbi:heat-inducible transcription repressor HrcA [Striga asiatica]|uniref:Heat-inducible transcription repressor HrcA n=1 Tax=Striga asiatica TaxID=4170 RepID=A0A5A7R4Y1_STRAF|nr:heat-inducible transcription repressor HrcA [Striga asiatica]